MSEKINPVIDAKITENIHYELTELLNNGDFGVDDYGALQDLVEENLFDYYEKEDPSIYAYLLEHLPHFREVIISATTKIYL